MVLDLTSCQNGSYDCYQCALSVVLEYYKRKYYMFSLSKLGYCYKKTDNEIIGNSIDRSQRVSIDEALLTYHGITIKNHFFSKESIDNIISCNLRDNKPIIVKMDLFWLVWDPFCQKYHFPHYILNVGYDAYTDKYIWIDPYISSELRFVGIDEIYIGIQKIKTIEFTDKLQKQNLYYALYKDVCCYLDKSQEDNLYNTLILSKDIQNVFDLDRERGFYGDDIYAIPIMNNIREIYTSRMSYSLMLSQIDQNYSKQILRKYSNKVKDIGEAWKTVWCKLAKIFISGINYENKIGQLIEDIGVKEIKWAEELKKTLECELEL